MSCSHLQGHQGDKNPVGLPGHAWGPVCLLWRGWPRIISPQKGRPRGWQWSSSWHKGKFPWSCSLLWLRSIMLTGGGYTDWFFHSRHQHQGPPYRGRDHGIPLHHIHHVEVSSVVSLNHGGRHSWSSCTVLQSISGGIPEWLAQLWRAMASTTISLHCASQYSWISLKSLRGR